MADRIGQQLDNYRLIRLLGAGGFGEVYLAEHSYRKTQVAIKILPQLAQDDLQGFLTEARTFRLKHPNIVQVLDFGVEGRTPFIVMEYAPNGTLRQRHPRGATVPLPTVVSYVKQVASALQYAHDDRLIHRDVKPENMLLGPHNEVLLSDFGIATMAHRTSSQSIETMTGTIPYMAPEQIQAHPRPASDQYSLGVVVYEWLSGDRPFQGTLTEVAVKHTMVPPPPLRERVPTISPAIEQIVMTALVKDPKQRFGSVLAFATALEQASQLKKPEPQPVPIPPAPMTTDPGRSQRPTIPVTTAMQSMTSDGSVDTSASPPYGSILPGQMIQAPVVVPPLRQSPQQVHIPIVQSKPELVRRGISRRTVVVGFGVAGLVVVGGSIVGLALFYGQHPSPIPLGTRLFTYRGHSSLVWAVGWSPNGTRIASGSGDNTVQMWDAATGGNVYTYQGHSNIVYAVVWSPDGKRIASGSRDHTVQVWDAATGGNVFSYKGHTDTVFAVAWSPNGRYIASGSNDKTVRVWDATTGGKLLYTYTGTSFVYAVAWSPDSRYIASGSLDTTVQVWDTTTGGHVLPPLRGHSSGVHAVTWSPNGRYIASGSADTTVRVWDAMTGAKLLTYKGHSDYVNAVAWSPDGKHIASGSGSMSGRVDITVQVWDAMTGAKLLTYKGHSDVVNAVAWSPDGTRIASGSGDHTVQVWGAG